MRVLVNASLFMFMDSEFQADTLFAKFIYTLTLERPRWGGSQMEPPPPPIKHKKEETTCFSTPTSFQQRNGPYYITRNFKFNFNS